MKSDGSRYAEFATDYAIGEHTLSRYKNYVSPPKIQLTRCMLALHGPSGEFRDRNGDG